MTDTTTTVTQAVIPSDAATEVRLAAALGPQYEVRRLVGRGGFAEVHEALDRQLDRRLAIKVLRSDLAWSAGTLTRFRDEARAIARLDHENILPIYFVGEGHGLVYYAMPFVDGTSLTELLRRDGPMPAERAIRVAHGVLDALAHAHAAGVIHRDIKPDNIMLEAATERVLLVDFGIAKRVGRGEPGTTQAGFVVGTPAYMSPEQALGQPDVDHRADLYALGAVLFQMLAGRPPYEGADSQEVAGKHVHAPVPRLQVHRPDAPAWLVAVVTRALAKQRDGRFQSAADMRAALDPGARPARRGPRSPAMLAGIIAGAAVLVAAALGAVTSRRSSLTVRNRLSVPVGVVAGREAERRIAAGDSLRLDIPRTNELPVTWYAIPVRGTRNQPLGDELQRSLVVDSRRHRLALEARADGTEPPMFQPLVTNATGKPLTFRINVGTAAERSCKCTVPAGARRMPIGFYPLYANSSIRAITPEGHVATYRGLGGKVDRGSGVVRIAVAGRDLRDSTALVARLR